ncbi:MAG: glycosyltransferase [Acidobacteriota bacterium]|nr:glycosyltransferase [Acidobacteriota bacterium]MDH3525292.1 glycosyltransferase [Acidobacteriota bacterium]
MSPPPERLDLLIFSSVHWHFTWQRHHEVAAGLARLGYGVTYLEPIPKRWPGPGELGRVLGRLRGRHEDAGLVRQRLPARVRLRAVTAAPDTGPVSRMLNRSLVVPRAARRLGRELGRPLVILNYLPLAASVALQRRLAPDLAIYDCVWDWPNDPYSRPGVVREEELLAAVDLVFADAPYLFERMRAAHDHVERVLPAVDYDLYEPARRRRGSGGAGGARLRCAYFGAVGANVDRGLLVRLSHEFRLRVIGPVQERLEGLATETELLGAVPQAQVPELLADADVLVLPYREAGHSRGVVPAKTFECLATGKPTVAKGLPSLAEMGDLFYLAADADGFVAAVERAAAEPSEARERRLEAARRNTWRQRAAEIDGHIRQRLAAVRGR